MESIFHEKQEGYLCAQHCLNALLQGPYFNAVDLANLGHQLDEEERMRMAESGVDGEDYKHFLEQPSGNMDDTGYFSVQVISSALKVWGLELIPYNSTEPTALLAQNDPSQMEAYICNYKGHWFTIRKIGKQWFNLNSMLNGPQLISDTYLAMTLAQLLHGGYSIFIVMGTLPECPADDVLMKNPVVVVPEKRSTSIDGRLALNKYQPSNKVEEEAFNAALALGEVKVPVSSRTTASTSMDLSLINNLMTKNYDKSKSDSPATSSRERIIPIQMEDNELDDDENAELQRAVQLSLEDSQDGTDESIQQRLDMPKESKASRVANAIDDTEEEEDLRRALQLSLECVTAPPTPDPEDLRWRRVKHFDMYSRPPNSETSQKLNI